MNRLDHREFCFLPRFLQQLQEADAWGHEAPPPPEKFPELLALFARGECPRARVPEVVRLLLANPAHRRAVAAEVKKMRVTKLRSEKPST